MVWLLVLKSLGDRAGQNVQQQPLGAVLLIHWQKLVRLLQQPALSLLPSPAMEKRSSRKTIAETADEIQREEHHDWSDSGIGTWVDERH